MDTYNNPLTDDYGYPLTLHFCGKEVCAPSHAFGPATRQHFLLHFVTDGCGTYEVSGRRYKVSKNQGFMIFPGDTTFYEADAKTPWTYYWISFSGPATNLLLKSCNLSYNNHLLLPNDGALASKTIQEVVHKASAYTHDVASKYTQISDLFMCFSTLISAPDKEHNAPDNYALQAATYIEENYAYNIKIANLAKHIGVERTYLYRLFKSTYFMSPQSYLIQCRLKKAKALLVYTSMPIAEIAYSVGFSSNALFYRHFTEFYNMTPRRCRNL